MDARSWSQNKKDNDKPISSIRNGRHVSHCNNDDEQLGNASCQRKLLPSLYYDDKANNYLVDVESKIAITRILEKKWNHEID